MRAVWFGLLGAVLAAGAAQAKVCKLDGLELVAKARADGAPGDLVGSRYRVVRQSSRFATGFDSTKGRNTTHGAIVVELVGDRGRYFVRQDYEPSTMPWISAASATELLTGGRPNWKSRNRREEARLFEPDGSFEVYTGPLAGLSLEPTNCR